MHYSFKKKKKREIALNHFEASAISNGFLILIHCSVVICTDPTYRLYCLEHSAVCAPAVLSFSYGSQVLHRSGASLVTVLTC